MAVNFKLFYVFKVVGNNPCAENKWTQQLDSSLDHWVKVAFFSVLKFLSFWQYSRLYVEEFPYPFFHNTSVTYKLNTTILSSIP